MTTISLRNYNREAEILIDQGAFDEAINHCKHILKFHPKHVDTYRLLGKAYLDNKRYSEAADIFQRVLSVLPDDFISQIGMSIIREDEGNFDAAIWHIERAFEVQPSNAAIQDEIRRLYGRRDGTHLSKIRLTRGALIRMYLQGELYNQAISETRAALADDPLRMDLEVLLARLYYLSGNKVEAAEVCTSIIKKLPFCLEAIKILSVILTSLNRSDEALTFQKRIYALQPYAAHISKNAPTLNQVPDNAVTLDKLDKETFEDTIEKQPSWAQTIGVELESEEEKSLPDWLPSLASERLIPSDEESEFPLLDEEISKEFKEDVQEEEPVHEIPEWMKTAGWEKKPDGDSLDTPLLPEEMKELESAEIPEWLQGLSPDENKNSNDDDKETKDHISPEIPDPSIVGQTEEESDLETGEIPEWLHDFSPEKPNDEQNIQSEPVAPPAEIKPEALLESQSEDEFAALFSSAESDEKHDEGKDDFSSWLQTLDSDTDTEDDPDEHEDKMPEWLEKDEPVAEEKPDSVPEQQRETPEAQQLEEAHEQIDEAMDWLTSIAGTQDTEQETLMLSSEKKLDLPAEWIKEYVETEDESSTDPSNEIVENQDVSDFVNLEPDPLLSDSTEELETQETEDKKTESIGEIDDAFSWLESLAAKQGADEQTLFTEAEDRDETPPDWLNSFTSEIDQGQETIEEPALETSSEEEPEGLPVEIEDPSPESSALPPEPEIGIEEEIVTQDSLVDEATISDTEMNETKQEAETKEIDISPEAKSGSVEAMLSEITQENIDITLPQIDAHIKQGEFLNEIIIGLENAIIYQPLEAPLYQVLGDAYAKNNQLQKALDSYTKAEELLF